MLDRRHRHRLATVAVAQEEPDQLGEVGFVVGEQPHHVVPIVPTAVLFDLERGGRFENRPNAEFGRLAAAAARSGRVGQGSVGAGTGAVAGGLKGGMGTASTVLANGLTVAALVALVCFLGMCRPRSGWAGAKGGGI